MPDHSTFTAIVLAGDRGPRDPVAAGTGVSGKAVANVNGTPMIIRVLDALAASPYVDEIIICGPSPAALSECPQLQDYLARDTLQRVENLDSPSKSVEAAMSLVPADRAVFLTTADHALLETKVIDFFLAGSLESEADATVGLVKYDTILENFPQVKRTGIRLGDGGVCGCNLFSFTTAEGRGIVPFWRKVEQKRKKPWKLIMGLLGPTGVIKYALNKLQLEDALTRISSGLRMRINAVVLPYPRAGIDVDTMSDLEFVENLLQEDS